MDNIEENKKIEKKLNDIIKRLDSIDESLDNFGNFLTLWCRNDIIRQELGDNQGPDSNENSFGGHIFTTENE